MRPFSKGRYSVRVAKNRYDIEAAQKLRSRAFTSVGQPTDAKRLDRDRYDLVCSHILIEDRVSGGLVCCFRILPICETTPIKDSYSAQVYQLSALEKFQGRMVEMGRFCVSPDIKDPDILRLAWAVMSRYVDQNNVRLLFGCSSFAGLDAARYLDAFALLKARYLAPECWRPHEKAPDVFRFSKRLDRCLDLKLALARLPPLLKFYLMMGGWVSDHAVVDHHMRTLHVFTGVEITKIPAARKRLLRAMVP